MNRATWLKAADVLLGPAACALFSRWRHGVRREPETVDIRPEALRRILVIRPGGMGDMIVLLPVLRRLSAGLPHAAVDVVCEKRNVAVLELAGLGDRALVYDACPWAFLRALRGRGYDAVLDTEQFHHFSAVIAALSRAPARIGFKINPRRNALYTHMVNYAPDGPEGEQFGRLLTPLGLDPGPYRLAGALAGDRPPAPEPRVVIQAGASSPYKQWSPRNWAELVGRLAGDGGLGVTLVGTRRERGLLEAVVRPLPRETAARVEVRAGALALPEIAALLRRARLFAGGDSGLAHLAVAVGTPTVVLFGPSDHLKWGTEDARHVVVRQPVPCAPCFIFGYHKPCRSARCMAGISVPDVLAACRTLLAAG